MRRLLARITLVTAGIVATLMLGLVLIMIIDFLRRGPDYSILLPSGYELVQIHSDVVVLTRYRRDVLAPTIDGYRLIDGRLVIGHIEKKPGFDSTLGYFVVDTNTHEIWKGLSEHEMMIVLAKYHIDEKPGLRRPSRLYSLFQ